MLEIGDKVTIIKLSDNKELDGTVCDYWRQTTKNQVCVSFVDDRKCLFTFSRKTGKQYGCKNCEYKLKVI